MPKFCVTQSPSPRFPVFSISSFHHSFVFASFCHFSPSHCVVVPWCCARPCAHCLFTRMVLHLWTHHHPHCCLSPLFLSCPFSVCVPCSFPPRVCSPSLLCLPIFSSAPALGACLTVLSSMSIAGCRRFHPHYHCQRRWSRWCCRTMLCSHYCYQKNAPK